MEPFIIMSDYVDVTTIQNGRECMYSGALPRPLARERQDPGTPTCSWRGSPSGCPPHWARTAAAAATSPASRVSARRHKNKMNKNKMFSFDPKTITLNNSNNMHMNKCHHK